MKVKKIIVFFAIVFYILIGALGQFSRSSMGLSTTNEDEEDALSLLRRLLRLGERTRMKTPSPNTPTSSLNSEPKEKERPPINLNIIVVPVLHEKGSGGKITEEENENQITAQSSPSTQGTITRLSDRISFPDDDDDDLDVNETANFGTDQDSTPAPGVINPTTPRPSCGNGERWNPHLGECTRIRSRSPNGGVGVRNRVGRWKGQGYW